MYDYLLEPYDAIPTCQFEGKLYREGQKMYPKDRCYKCVCKSGFKGLLEEPFCKRYKCAFEKNKSKALEQNCALVYSNEVCCPSGYACRKYIKCYRLCYVINKRNFFKKQMEKKNLFLINKIRIINVNMVRPY